MGSVTVSGIDFDILGTLQGAKDYLIASIGDGPDAWNALATDDLKSKYLVAATRYLFGQRWQGTPVSLSQLVAFPRNDIVDIYGNDVSGTVPEKAMFAEYEMAALLAANAALASSTGTGSNVKRMEAGPVNLEYFRPTDTLDTATIMPKVVMDLVGEFLAASIGGETGSTAYGVDPCEDSYAESRFEDCDEYTRVVR